MVTAYDGTLPATGKGTNVLFLDNHVEFIEPEGLAGHGLPAGPDEASATPEKQADDRLQAMRPLTPDATRPAFFFSLHDTPGNPQKKPSMHRRKPAGRVY